MSPPGAAPLQIALLHHSLGSMPGTCVEQHIHDLAAALRGAGHSARLITSPSTRMGGRSGVGVPSIGGKLLPEALLQRRGFAGPLAHLPLTLRDLAKGNFDVAHSFSPADALAAWAWASVTHRPVAFTCIEPLRRDCLAHLRLRRLLLSRAVEGSDGVIVPTETARAALWRWMAVEAPVIEAWDAAAHERLYRELLATRGH